jgi:hypothetical protein
LQLLSLLLCKRKINRKAEKQDSRPEELSVDIRRPLFSIFQAIYRMSIKFPDSQPLKRIAPAQASHRYEWQKNPPPPEN